MKSRFHYTLTLVIIMIAFVQQSNSYNIEKDELIQTKNSNNILEAKNNEKIENKVVKIKKTKEKKVFDIVDQMPMFPGGDGALMEYLRANVRYPVTAMVDSIQGTVVATFVVEKDGSINGVRITRSVAPSLDQETLRVIRSMPNWMPGRINGSAVRVKYNVPVSFRLK